MPSSTLIIRIALCFLGLVSTILADRILVVLGHDLVEQEYSQTWRSLEGRGHELTFRTIGVDGKTAATSSSSADPSQFQHLICFAPSTKQLSDDLSPQNLIRYTQQGINLLVVVSSQVSEFWRDFGREFDIEFDDRGTLVIDHFAYDVAQDQDGLHSAIVVPVTDCQAPFVSRETRAGAPVLYRGIGHSVGRRPLAANVLHASSSAYSGDITRKDPLVDDLYLAGTSIGLVTAFQTKDNARVSFVGSTDLFSDAFVAAGIQSIGGTRHPHSGNAAFIADITRWTFQESGVLHIEGSRHRRSSDGRTHSLYRVGEELTFEIDLAAKNEGKWSSSDLNDLQLEFTMLDPHLRVPLEISGRLDSTANDERHPTRYSARFRAPDRHGVFTLRVDYRRPGWTFLDDKTVISITPPRHDQFDRFITGALPYYGGAVSVSLATIFVVSLLALQ